MLASLSLLTVSPGQRTMVGVQACRTVLPLAVIRQPFLLRVSRPLLALRRISMTKLDAWKIGGAALLLCVATAICAQAQRFVSLVDFDGTNGEAPEYMSLVQGIDGNFYGTTGGGGANCPASYGCGTVFKVTADGTAI